MAQKRPPVLVRCGLPAGSSAPGRDDTEKRVLRRSARSPFVARKLVSHVPEYRRACHSNSDHWFCRGFAVSRTKGKWGWRHSRYRGSIPLSYLYTLLSVTYEYNTDPVKGFLTLFTSESKLVDGCPRSFRSRVSALAGLTVF